MSSQYKSTEAVPDHVLLARVAELVDAVTKGSAGSNEFTMRVPAECDRDADLVLTELAIRYRQARNRASKAEAKLKELYGFIERLKGECIDVLFDFAAERDPKGLVLPMCDQNTPIVNAMRVVDEQPKFNEKMEGDSCLQ